MVGVGFLEADGEHVIPILDRFASCGPLRLGERGKVEIFSEPGEPFHLRNT